MTTRDLAIVGAGPAGMAAAATAAEAGLDVLLLDDQPAAGGQVYRGLKKSNPALRRILGADYQAGEALIDGVDEVEHLSGAVVWNLTPELELYFARDGTGGMVRARHVILANGAIERPMPFPGWTLPGVMTAGGAQILLKASGLLPAGRTVLAGSGPLLLLLAAQYLRAGVKVEAIVETGPAANPRAALKHLPGALRASSYLLKGLALLRSLRRHRVPHYKQASKLVATGGDAVEALSFDCAGSRRELACDRLLIHNGVTPNVQITRALGLAHDWDGLQRCWRPRLGPWGETEIAGLAVAGDGAGIGGAAAAAHAGHLAGLHAARELGALSAAEAERSAVPERRALAYHRAARPFLDALYAPAPEFLAPADETVVCRCEEVTAGTIHGFVRLGCLGPNQTKSFGRPGMGPCQGRYCGLTVSEVIAAARGVPVDEVGYYRIRPPIKPVTLGEIAASEPAS